MVCDSGCQPCLDLAGSGKLTAGLARAYGGLEARFTTHCDHEQLMPVLQ